MFIILGIFFVAYSPILLKIAFIPEKTGMIFNTFLLIFDCVWFLGLGIFSLFLGVLTMKEKQKACVNIQAGGHLLLFTLVFLFTSIVFNNLANPVWASSGRVFTFIFQTLFHLFNRPSILSSNFLVPLGGIVIYAVAAIWFQKSVIKKIGEG